MEQWYYSRDGRTRGPVSLEALSAEAVEGRLKPEDFVWTRRFAEWQRAATIPALFSDGRAPTPPPLMARREDRLGASEPHVAAAERVGLVPPLAGTGSFVVRHWRGELALWESFWLCGVLASILIGIALSLIAEPVAGSLTRRYLATAAVVAAVLALSLSLSIWQYVGIWRSATRAMQSGRARLWPMLAKTVVVLGTFGALLRLVPLAVISYDNARIGLSLSGFERPQVALTGTTLTIRGDIGPGAAALVEDAIRGRRVQAVELESRGGLMDEAHAIATMIHARTADTFVPRTCHSACTFILLAGNRRTIGPGAEIGFHQPSAPVFDELLVPRARRAYLEAGVPAAFVDRILATPPSELLTPSPNELIALGIIHEMTQSAAERAELATALRAYPQLAALERFDRAQFDGLLDTLMPLARDARRPEEILARVSPIINGLVQRYAQRAEDALIAELIAFNRQRAAWLLERDAETCAASARPASGAVERVSMRERPELLARWQGLFARIIESAARRGEAARGGEDLGPAMERLISAVSSAPGTNVEILDQERLAPAEYAVACRTVLAMLDALIAMPEGERVGIYRLLLAPAP